MRSISEARRKRVIAVGLLSEGLSYDEIAKRAGYKHRGSAYKAVSKALSENEAAEVENLRTLEVSRLDALQRAHWDSAMSGDIEATTVILKVMQMRLKVLGLIGGPPPKDPSEQPLRSMILGS